MKRERMSPLSIQDMAEYTRISTETRRSRRHIRLAIGILCFVCFVYMDQSKTKVADVDSRAIVNQIEKNMDADTIREVWKAL